jgi:hypothetical protein
MNSVTPRLFIAATRQNEGKTTTSLGLLAAIQRYYPRVGYIKPVGQRFVEIDEQKIDEDTVLMDRVYKLNCPLVDMSPIAVEPDFTRRYIDEARNDFLVRRIQNAFDRAAWEKDFVIIVTCGGGSVLFEKPHTFTLEHMISVNKALLASGATISEMNVIRKHLSQVKGGGLAKILFPATVVNLIFSDVPGNDLSVIASAPLVKDPTSAKDAIAIFDKYALEEDQLLSPQDFIETPKEDQYFDKVHNILLVSNLTALTAMEKKARSLGYEVIVTTDRQQGDARVLGKELIQETPPGQILLAGGESTIKDMAKEDAIKH